MLWLDTTSPLGGDMVAPKASPISGGVIVLGELDENDGEIIRADGATQAFTPGHKLSGPPATAVGSSGNPTVMVVSFWDNDELRFLENNGGNYSERSGTRANSSQNNNFPVVLPRGATTAVVAGEQSGNDVYAVAVFGRSGSGRFTLGGPAAPIHVAAACTPGRANVVVTTKTGSLASLAVANDATAAISLRSQLNPSSPGQTSNLPAVILDRVSGDADVFTAWQGSPSSTIWRHAMASADIGSNGASAWDISGTVTGMALVVHGGVGQLAVASSTGTLHIRNVTSVASDIAIPLSSAALGGVVAVTLVPSDSAPTFFVGDGNGKIHAVRDGAELTQFGFPLSLPASHVVTQPPLLFREANGLSWGLVVVSEVGSTGHVTAWKLGTASSTPGQWPQHQADETSRGCVVFP